MRPIILAAALWAAPFHPAPADEPDLGEHRGSKFAKALSERLKVRAEGFELAGRPAFVLLPEAAAPGRPWILYAPALPAYPDEHERWMHQRFLANGVAVAGIDAGEAYGSPNGRAAMSALYDELVTRRGFSPKVCLFGRSRGGLWVANWAGEHPERVAGIIGIYPAFDLRTYPGLEKAAPAYELTPEELEAQLPKLNPIEQARKLAKANVPAILIHGMADEVVPFRENSGRFAAEYLAAGADEKVKVLAIEGQGHNFWEGFFRSQELVDFAIAHAKEAAKAVNR
jgi:dipeptidyl aminopeptidase/acylaminoacyl peptidase